MVIASSDKGDRAFVVALLRIGMEAFVKLGRHRKGNREKKSNDRSAGDEGPLHGAASFCRSPGSRKSFLQNRHLHQQVVAALVPSADLVYQSANAQC